MRCADTALSVEQLTMHPNDLALVQRAADSQKLDLGEFILLAAYSHARDLLADLNRPHPHPPAGGLCSIAHHCPQRPLGLGSACCPE